MSRPPIIRQASGPLSLLQAAEVARWYEELSPHVRRWLEARGVVSGREADDIIQDVFVRVIEYSAKLATLSDAHRRGYVFAIALSRVRNAVRHYYTRAGHTMPFAVFADTAELNVTDPASAEAEWLAHAQPESEPEQTTAARMTLRAVWNATPAEYRELLLLVAQGYSQHEMATMLGMSEQAVSTRIWRMRRLLLDAGERIA